MDRRIITLALTALLCASTAWGRINQAFVGPRQSASESGGWTYIGVAVNSTSGASATLDTSTSLDVNDGDVLVAAMRYEIDTSTCSFAATTGAANSFNGDIVSIGNGDTKLCVGYLLNASNNDTATFRGTLQGDRSYKRIAVLQFRPVNTGVAQSGGTPVTGTGTTTSLATAPYTSSGVNPLLVAFAGAYNGNSSAFQIGGVAADGGAAVGTSGFAYWYKIGSVSNGTASATHASFQWAAAMLEIK